MYSQKIMQYVLLWVKNCLKSCKDVRLCDKYLNQDFKMNLIITFLVSKIKMAWKWAKKGDFKNPKVVNCDFSTESVPE